MSADADAASSAAQHQQAECEQQMQHVSSECNALKAQLQDAKTREDNARK